jgi:hypothetical protein
MSTRRGLWSAGLLRRLDDTPPPCVGCPPPERELTLLWRRSKRYRRHRVL